MASSRSSSSIEQRRDSVVHCNCKCPTKICRAWTAKNPGRRFYTCRGRKSGNGYENCNFFEWFDVEKPNGWQHEALLEARGLMNRQKEEIQNLKDIVASLESEGSREISYPSDLAEELKQIREDNANLKRDVLILTKRSLVYRNVLITSSVGFTVAIGLIMAMWKQ